MSIAAEITKPFDWEDINPSCATAEFTITDPEQRSDGFFHSPSPGNSTIATFFYETIRTLAPGILYKKSDGIQRFRPTAAPTSTRSEMVTVIKTLHDYRKKMGYDIQAPVSLVVQTFGFGEGCTPWTTSYLNWNREIATGKGNRVVSQGVESNSKNGVATVVGYDECNLLPIDEVILFHWPGDFTSNDAAVFNATKASTVADNKQPQSVVSSMITFDGQNVYPRGMLMKGNYTTLQQGYISPYTLTGPFTFTSPTIYLAHRHVKARYTSLRASPGDFDMKLPGTTTELRGPGVLAVDAKSIWSLRHFPRNMMSGVEFAQLVANGNYDPGWGMEEPYMQIRPMNFAHLENPVPASVFYEARSEDCFGQQTHCATITVRHQTVTNLAASRYYH
jgi:hypothetical protein